MNVLTSITVLGFLIFFHEMGHFLAAILQGIYVDGFSIGFGPSIIQKKYKNITYSFRAFPLGGFVSFPDEEINNIDPKDPNLLKNRPIFQRVIVISAGVLANLVLAEKIRHDFPSLKVHYNAKATGMKSQFKKADKSQAKIAMIVGEDELQAEQVTLKYLREDKPQRTINLSELKLVLADYFVNPVTLSISP